MSSETPAEGRSTPSIEFKRLGQKIRRGAFVCGEREIDAWTTDAYKDHGRLTARTWAAHLKNNDEIAGLYALRIRLESDADIDGHNGVFRSEDSRFAAVQLMYLGVQRPLQRVGIGELMMVHAIREFAHVADRTGICAMTLVAINAEKAEWYRKLGFRQYGKDCERPKMFLPALTALAML